MMPQEQRTTTSNETGQPFSPPSISLPKGGGAIRGIGEKFAANPVTGTGSMTVPIATSPGRSGFGPQLSLSYDSGSGNGPFGFGWSLGLPSITRKTDKGLPQYCDAEESDVFILSGAEDLVPVLKEDVNGNLIIDDSNRDGYTVRWYRPRIEGLFARIERWTRQSDGDVHWRSISRDNVLTLYGKDEESRIADPEDQSRIFSWLICETRDDKGNGVLYEYEPEDGAGVDLTRAHERNRGDRNDPRRTANRYLKRIRYGNLLPLLDPDTGQRPRFLTPQQIQNAGWMFEVVFDYGEHHAHVPKPNDAGEWTYRDDPFSSYRAGFEVRTCRLCQRVLMFHHFEGEPGVGNDCVVRSTDFTYSHEQDPDHARNPIYTFLMAVTQTGYKRQGDGYVERSLPPVEFKYTQPNVQDTVRDVDDESLENLPIGLDGTAYQWTDLHGEGIPGILTEQGGAWFYKRNLSPINVRSDDGVTHTEVKFAPVESVVVQPNLALAGGQAQLVNLAGDGQPDLVVLDGPMPGLYEHDGDEGWQPFRPFASRLNRDTRDPNLKFVDLDGDGHADVLISEDDAFVWHASLAEEGFGPARRVHQALDEEKGPRLIFADGTQSIYLADLSGDGLTDLVRIRNGEVCYWPNLGYGRFGAKVTMDHAPLFDRPDHFDQRRIRLADIDGTGTTDIIYLHRDGARLYFNQSGNSWSEPQPLRVFPRVDDLVAITPTDLLGNGTACLVWSSPLPGDTRRQMRYVDLMGGKKPHLLERTTNNLGAETRVEYASSTKFYLRDRRAGKPWITRLPFPVHVVELVETFDWISRNRFVTRYCYHHGYFDGEEREFRGFGMVEQQDTESFAALSGSDEFPTGDNVSLDSHVPPVLTKTWFHTGVYTGRARVSDFFAGLLNGQDHGEYYREPAWRDNDVEARKRLLPDTPLPPDLTIEEEREACRALKGAMLRQEVYALDDSDDADYPHGHPYTVTEQNFTIRCEQRRDGNRHGVFFTHPRESISYHYEREPADPRISHTLTLEVDDFGNVRRSVTVGYPRAAPAGRQPEQNATHVTFTLSRFANRDDQAAWRRIGLPVETRTYEVVKPPAAALRLTWDEVRDLLEVLVPLAQVEPAVAKTIPYEQWDWRQAWDPAIEPGGATHTRLRLIEHVRTRYRPDDLGVAAGDPLTLLELDAAEQLALPGETYKLAFTPGLLAAVYGGRVTDAMLGAEGGYVHSEGDANWWVPSGRVLYSANMTDGAAAELAYARQHFFLPHRYRDPFHTNAAPTETVVTYDAYDLLVLATRDPLLNLVTAATDDGTGDIRNRSDYRVLQPSWVTDPNGNRTRVAFDALGMVAGTAVMGKADEVRGDPLATFEPDLTQAQIDEFYDAADPHDFAEFRVQDATTRIIYDLHRFATTRAAGGDPKIWQPAFAATLARERHSADASPPGPLKVQISFSYSDGFGREIQKKIQAEPGPVADGGPSVDPRWVGSGWTVFNNKGKPVRQYEPFFGRLSKGHQFEFGRTAGVSPVLFYDPAERVVATLHPNHTYEKVVFDPWHQVTYDVNDTAAPRAPESGDPRTDADVGGYVANYFAALDGLWQTWYEERITGAKGAAEQDAATKAANHANTPTTAHLDALGRPFLTLAHNGFSGAGIPIQHATRVRLDIEGNQREVRDAKDRLVMRYDYDMLGNRAHQASMEAGERWTLNDVAGKAIRAWDSRKHEIRTEYDELRRPIAVYLRDDGAAEVQVGRTIYGESDLDAASHNLRGRVLEVMDQAGVLTTGDYDFKGNVLESRRRLAVKYRETLNWLATPATHNETFVSHTRYDALNRPIQLIAPHSDQGPPRVNVVQPTYNPANLLEKVHVWLGRNAEPSDWLDPATATMQAVTNVDYNPKGQRTLIEYGNGAKTTYTYDEDTFRLIRLKTTRPTSLNGLAAQLFADPTIVQDLQYAYDPAGNITTIANGALPTIQFNNENVEPDSRFTYDAIYRLIEATGREHIGQTAFDFAPADGNYRDYPFVGLRVSPNDPKALRRYTETYAYDEVGNIDSIAHAAMGGAWTRNYVYGEASVLEATKKSNRLTSTTLDTPALPYAHDAHGNMTSMPHLQRMEWDYRDQLQATARQKVNGGTPETTWYVYDANGQRVRKVTDHDAEAGVTPTRKAERIYLGGLEIYRAYESDGSSKELERETIHVMDDKQRIAVVETKTVEAGSAVSAPTPLHRYQLANHLGSASAELAEDGALISYEEFHPYGTSSFQAWRTVAEVSSKRYRYTGKERDEESGFSYIVARYFYCAVARWCSPDPAGLVDGTNLYTYARSNPIQNYDESGLQAVSPVVRTRTLDDVLKHVVSSAAATESDIAATAAIRVLEAMMAKHASDIASKGISEYGGSQYEGAEPIAMECGCLTFVEVALKEYFSSMEKAYNALGELGDPLFGQQLSNEYWEQAQDLAANYSDIIKAYESSDKRGTALLRELHERAGWKTVYFDTGRETGVGRSSRVSKRDLYPARATREDYQTPIDYYIDKLEDPSKQTPTSQHNLGQLEKVPFAVGVVDSGKHTFVFSLGQVYEVHWELGPSDPGLFQVSALEAFMKDWKKSGVVAIPSELLRYHGIEFRH